jgi:hypothetical protein
MNFQLMFDFFCRSMLLDSLDKRTPVAFLASKPEFAEEPLMFSS